MKIACPSCAAKYSIADDKVLNRLAKIRCRKCSTTIVIDGKTSPPTVQAAGGGSVHPGAATVSHAPAAASALPGGSSYTVDLGEHDQRPMNVAELVEAYNSGVVTADTYVWQDGMADWAPLGQVPEINDALHAAANPAAAVAAPAYVAPAQPAFSPSAATFGAIAAKEPARAATRADARADLFGGIDTAGSERGGIGGAAQITTAATGARNESSVLFSLSALTADEKPRPAPSAGPLRTVNAEDSGLIDLAALAAAAESGNAALSTDLGPSPLAGMALGASPFGAAPLSGGTTSPLGAEAHARASGRGGLYIGGGIAIAAIVGGLVYLLKEEPPQAAIPAPPTTVIVTQIATAAPPPVATEVAKAETADDKKADDKASTIKRRPSTRKPSGSSGGTETPKPSKGSDDSSGAIKTDPKPKPKSKCNCAPSDLLCAMKCSTK